MRRVAFEISMLCFISVFLITSAIGFNSDPNKTSPNDQNDKRQRPYIRENASKPFSEGGYKGGHDTITAEAVNLKKQIHGDDDKFKTWADLDALPGFRTGTHDEDSTFRGDEVLGSNGKGGWYNHFLDAETGKGLFSFFQNAPDKAVDQVIEAMSVACNGQWRGDFSQAPPSEKNRFYDRFGRAMHLLQDTSVPSHVKNGWSTMQYLHGVYGPQGYMKPILETYIEENWGEIIGSQTFKEKVTADHYGSGEYALPDLDLRSTMRDSAQKASAAPDDTELYDIRHENDNYIFTLNKDKLRDTAEKQTAEAVLRTAGFVDAIYNEIKNGFPCDKNPPGEHKQDHADDSFDLSTWEKKNTQSNMSDYDLLGFFMPVGLKKGNLSTFYARQFAEIMAEAKAGPTNPSQEMQDSVNSRFRRIVDGLELATTGTPDESPDVALLKTGFHSEMMGLINKHKEPVRLVDVDFSPAIVKNQPVLVIPSGGLSGMAKSDFFKTSLNQYVKSGGTLIVFAQQQGSDYSGLPVPEEPDGTYRQVGGYGWNQDQNCFIDAVFIKTWHQMLSGQERSTPTLNVDGYFTQYPSATTVVLNRTANNQPALIVYEHGQGKVIVTAMYSDFAFAHSQASSEEIALVRDMIAWAKKPAVLPETTRSGTTALSIPVVNIRDVDAAAVKVLISTPDRSAIASERTFSSSLPAGTPTELSISYSAPQDAPLGIYHVDYLLLDASGNVLQPQTETDSGRFAVIQQPKIGAPDKDFWFYASTPSQEVAYGSPMEYTFHVYNNTPYQQQLQIDTHWGHTGRAHSFTIAVPPKSESTLSAFDPCINYYETLHSLLSGGSAGYASEFLLSFRAYEPTAGASVSGVKSVYNKGDLVEFQTAVTNSGNLSAQFAVAVRVYGSASETVYSEDKILDLPAHSQGDIRSSFALPTGFSGGSYQGSVAVFSQGFQISGTTFRFEVAESRIVTTPNTPAAFTGGQNNISFSLVNEGKVAVQSGTFSLALIDPVGVTVFSEARPFSLAPGGATTIDFPVTLPPTRIGDYRIVYSLSDETKTPQPITLPFSSMAVVGVSKDLPTHRIRQTANFSVNISDTGQFDLNDMQVTLAIPGCAFTETKAVSLTAGQNTSVPFSAQIGENIPAGSYPVNVTTLLPSGATLSASSTLFIPASSLRTTFLGPSSLQAGDAIQVTVENIGGVDTEYSLDRLRLTDPNEVVLYENVCTGSVAAGATATVVNVPIPRQAASTKAVLDSRTVDLKTKQSSDVQASFTIHGLEASVSGHTDKEIYLSAESPVALSDLANGPKPLEGGTLDLRVYSLSALADARFTHFLPKNAGWIPDVVRSVATDKRGSVYTVARYRDGAYGVVTIGENLRYLDWFPIEIHEECRTEECYPEYPALAADTDGFVYVGDKYTQTIFKYSKTGTLVTQWGGQGSGDGQFTGLTSIGVGPDASVYVADCSGIQKFDGSGNFLSRFATDFSCVEAVTVDAGSLYALVRENDRTIRVRKFDPAGTLDPLWQDHGGEDFWYTNGLAVGSDGSIYVADIDGARLQRFDGDGNFVWKRGQYSNIYGPLRPQLVAVGEDGSIFAGDGDGNLLKLNKDLGSVSQAGFAAVSDGHFSYPDHVTADSLGSLYITDQSNRMQKFDSSGNFLASWEIPGTSSGQYYQTNGIATGTGGRVHLLGQDGRVMTFDGNGSLLYDWCGDGELLGIAAGPGESLYLSFWRYDQRGVQKVDKDGTILTQWGTQGTGDGEFDIPGSIAVGQDGAVYVVDNGNSRIQKFDENGNFIGKLESPTTGDGQFGWVEGIAVDQGNSVYLADTYSDRVLKFDSNGAFTGKWGGAGFNDGQFLHPHGITTDAASGVVYVADTENGRIQKFAPVTETTLFHTSLPVAQAGDTTRTYSTNVGKIGAAGKFYFSATLTNSLGQKLSESRYPFYVAEEETVIRLSTDKAIYKPGETVTITGDIRNLASTSANGLSVTVARQTTTRSEILSTFTCSVPANGVFPFMLTTQATSDGTYGLNAIASRDATQIAETRDRYMISTPSIAVAAQAPDVVGDDPFTITLDVRNTAHSEGRVTVDFDGRNQLVTIPAGGIVILTYSPLSINQDKEFVFTISGDANQTITRLVRYGLSATISGAPSPLYGEGRIAVPVQVSNNGLLDASLTATVALEPGTSYQRTYYIPQSQSVNDTFLFDLTEGNYTLTLTSRSPSATWSAPLFVRKESNVSLSPLLVQSDSGSMSIAANVVNNGYRTVDGSARMSVIDGSGVIVWQANKALSLVSAQTPSPTPELFPFNPSVLPPGTYTIAVDILDAGGRQLARQTTSLTVKDTRLQITQMPSPQTVYPGQEATFIFKVTNGGGKDGTATLRLRSNDFVDLTRTEWIAAGETKEFPFAFTVPADLEEKDYVALYELKGEQGVIASGLLPYHVNGIALAVSASLDKSAYSEGETARLTLVVSSLQPQNLFARVNYGAFADKRSLSLSGTESLTFDVPLAVIGPEKLFYGIYEREGRSIYLNSLYIRKAGDALTLATNKQVYGEGETVVVSASGAPGTLTLTAPGYEETFAYSGGVSKSFVLPSPAIAGTYFVEGRLTLPTQNVEARAAFEISGIEAKVYESNLDKGNYSANDTVKLAMRVESNRAMATTFKVWFVDPNNNAALVSEETINLTPGQTLLSRQYPLSTSVSGVHRLVYGFYWNRLLLASGGLAFDVGNGAILSMKSDRLSYPSGTEPVTMKVDVLGTHEATLSLSIDGDTTVVQQVSPSGFTTFDIPVAVAPGIHRITAVLSAGGLTSSKESTVSYGTRLADLVAQISHSPIGRDGTMKIYVSVENRGGSTGAATNVHLYEGTLLLLTAPISPLPPGMAQVVEFPWDVMGKAGTHTLKAVIDSEGLAIEYNKENNQTSATVTIPDGTFFLKTDKDSYKTGESVTIESTILNLTSRTADFITNTVIKNQGALQVYGQNASVTIPAQASSPASGTWLALTEGNFTITQRLSLDSIILGEQSGTITVAASPGFTASVVPAAVRVRQGEQAILTVNTSPVSGWTSSVAFLATGMPNGAMWSFSPPAIVPPGTSAFTVITGEAQAGSYTPTILIQGGGTVQSLPVSLDVGAFSVEPVGSVTVKQQETAAFPLRILSINGYAGSIALKNEGTTIRGLSIALDKQAGQVPCEATVRVVTSKYVTPGAYTIPISVSDGLVTKRTNLSLTVTENPDILSGVVTTPGAAYENTALVSLFNRWFSPLFELKAFTTRYGANAVMGDLDGDGEDEIIVAPGPDPSAEAKVRIYRQNGTLILEQKILDTKYGATLAVGDIDGDWKEEIVVGTGPAPLASSRLKVLSFNGHTLAATGIDFTAFPTFYKSGVNVALGDVDGDGVMEIIAGAGPGLTNQTAVRVFKVDTSGGIGKWKIESMLSDFTVDFGDGLTCCFGVNVAAGDIDGDDVAEIIVGAGPGPLKKPIVKTFRGNGAVAGTAFQAYPNDYALGVHVAARDLDGDGIDEIVTGPGPWITNKSWVKVFKGNGTPMSNGVYVYPSLNRYGAKVSTGNVGKDPRK
jgi:sugar lactone lactonase YvrE